MNNVEKFFQYLFTCFQGCGCVKFVLKLNVSLVIRRRFLQPLKEVLTIFADFFSTLAKCKLLFHLLSEVIQELPGFFEEYFELFLDTTRTVPIQWNKNVQRGAS